jgi:hypothetical protein
MTDPTGVVREDVEQEAGVSCSVERGRCRCVVQGEHATHKCKHGVLKHGVAMGWTNGVPIWRGATWV